MSSAPWRRSDLLPLADPVEGGRVDGWGWHLDGHTHGMSLDGLRTEIRTEVARVTAPVKGFVVSRPKVPSVALVAVPEEPRLRTVAEVPELAEVTLAREEESLSHQVATQRKPAILLGVLGALVAPFMLILGVVSLPLLLVGVDGVLPFLENRRRLRLLRADPAGFLGDLDLALRFQYWLAVTRQGWDWRTWGLVGAWAGLFLLQLATGLEASVGAAALVKPRLLQEPWRLLTGAFLHGSLMHLAMNGFGMLALGPMVERLADRRMLAPLWVGGALAGSLVSWAWQPQGSSVGASGGLMALIGYLACLGHTHRGDLPREFRREQVRSILLVVLLGVLAYRMIDNGGHLGGLLLGLAVGGVHHRRCTPLPLPPTPALRALDLLSLALASAAAGFTALRLLGLAG